MSNSTRRLLLACSVLSTSALIHPNIVFAQGTEQAAATADSGLEEIVVTARRREERVQTIPLAITVFDQKSLEQKHIEQVSDMARNVPSLVVTSAESDGNAIYSGETRIRGLAGSVVYFADVPLGSTDFSSSGSPFPHGLAPGYYFDLDNVEVLKGPQGTLFGKNSIGGLISIEPKKPTNDYSGYFKATFGNYNDREFEGAANVPVIADKLLVRIAGQSQQRDGYTKELDNGKDLDNRDYYAWRVGITFRPTDDLENYFLYDGYYQHGNGSATIARYVNPGFTLSEIPIPGASKTGLVPLTLGNGPALSALENPATQIATFEQLIKTYQSGGTASLSFFPNIAQVVAQQQELGAREVAGRATPGIGKDYFYGFTNTTTWDVADNLTIKNVAAARIFKTLSSADDFGGAGLPVLTVGDPINNQGWSDNSAQYTEEFQLQGKALADKLSWVFGGFLEFDHPIGIGETPSTALGNTTYANFHTTDRSQAVFAHGIYDLSDYVEGLRFTAGYRYTWDYVTVQERSTNGVNAVTRDANGMANNCGAFAFDNNCYSSSGNNFSSFGWNLSIDEQLDSNTLIYVRSGNAYRPGSTNPNVPAEFQALKPEHVTDVEIGTKIDWNLFGAHLRTNADLYHTDYKSIQVEEFVQVKDSQGNAHANDIETNAASAYLEGAEFEATVIPVTGVEISPHVSYLYTHYEKYPAVVGAPAGYAPPFNFAPKWQYGVIGTYHLPIDQSLGDIALSANYSWTGHQYDDGSVGEIYPIIPSFDQLDVRVDWSNLLSRPIDVAFFMTNALDTTHVQGVLPLYTQLGFTSLVYNEPRMFGFSVKYRFEPSDEPEAAPAAYVPPPVQAVTPAPRSYLVFFDFNKSDLTGQATDIVDTAAKNAAPAKVTQLTVTGHTDTVGSDAYNMRLSRRRAESVAARLEQDGIAANEIEIVAKGKRDLLVPTKDGVREPQNRRVKIVYSGGPAS